MIVAVDMGVFKNPYNVIFKIVARREAFLKPFWMCEYHKKGTCFTKEKNVTGTGEDGNMIF